MLRLFVEVVAILLAALLVEIDAHPEQAVQKG
jgi:hypothetical protein